ncbi:MAG: hypothetical protein IPG67_04760 [Acidobacteria bacterium]|nr:hypothetical protein [Acidobacteriota bacterium]
MSEEETLSKVRDIPKELEERAKVSKRTRWVATIGVSVFLLAMIGIFVVIDAGKVSVIVVAVGVVILALAIRHLSIVRCPGCEEAIEKRWGGHCPECGADGLKANREDEADCEACGRTLRVVHSPKGGDTLHFMINYCTSCGVLLVKYPGRKTIA